MQARRHTMSLRSISKQYCILSSSSPRRQRREAPSSLNPSRMATVPFCVEFCHLNTATIIDTYPLHIWRTGLTVSGMPKSFQRSTRREYIRMCIPERAIVTRRPSPATWAHFVIRPCLLACEMHRPHSSSSRTYFCHAYVGRCSSCTSTTSTFPYQNLELHIDQNDHIWTLL